MWLPFTPLYALQGLGELAGFIFGTCISPWRSETLLNDVTWQVGSSENRAGPLYRLLRTHVWHRAALLPPLPALPQHLLSTYSIGQELSVR